ncbi:MAG: OsmC family protein [Candidatus Sericytochromatia bacterium]|nr:OsmC family protein [Candidatus Sericytochromatia bacterium]
MSTHDVSVSWRRDRPDFTYDTYGRDHRWAFGTGSLVQASAAEAYKGNPDLVNPEEALVAALSSCHMLTFLAIAARRRFVVDSYVDDAMGYLEKNAAGRMAVTRVTLRPAIVFSGERPPSPAEIAHLHEAAHKECFIANSVTTVITVDSPLA